MAVSAMKYALFILAVFAFGTSGFIESDPCKGQCAKGDKYCQRICLDRGRCPAQTEDGTW